MTDQRVENENLRHYRLAAREWLADHVAPIGQRSPSEDQDVRVAEYRALQKNLYEAGYAGFTFPVEYGGQGLTLEHERAFMEESVSYDMPPTSFGVSVNILGATLVEFGTHEQKLAHVPNILAGRELWLQLLSEPTGGSDLAGLLTGATRDGDSFVVNGQKTWSTAAHLSDFALCPVRTRWDVPKHKGISVLIVDLRSPGIEIRRIKQIDGGSEFCEEFFTDVVVPATNLVGEENQGWRVARGLLEIEHAWVGRGWTRPGEDTGVGSLVAFAASRGLADDRGVRRRLVGLHVESEVQKMTSARVSAGVAGGQLAHGFGSLMKLASDMLIQRRSELALSLAGAEGVTWANGDLLASSWSRQYLTDRSMSIAGGTDEIQRNNVSEGVLGLPREPALDRDVPFNQVPHN